MGGNDKFNNFIKYLAITCVTCFVVGFGMIFARIHDYSRLASRSSQMDLDIVDEQSAGTADGVVDINIRPGSIGVNVLKSDSDEIKAVLSGFSSGLAISGDYELNVDRDKRSSGDQVDIEVEGHNFIVIGINHYKLDVYIPENYSKNLNVESSSGSIKIDGCSLSHVGLNSSSGSIKAGQLKADAIDIKTVSGSAALTNGTASMLDAKTSSGSLKLEGITVKNSMNASTTSGSIRAELRKFEGKAYIKSSSGSCRVDFPDDANLQINASSSSGSVKCDLPLKGTVKDHSIEGSVNGGQNPVEIRTSSGSIRIE